ncbi:MAG: mannose-1-phosphate guanylyltransferase/mannose-6-phosphate isomerase [Actinomycetota bacterium]|nr:mannose-1-phosphate guanylyltransferase/mannose-6-phosphate isomerase [Actinomycetota bacterium]
MTQAHPHLHAVILAGGSGARFWPLSREMTPKQMLSIFGGMSLIEQAVARIEPFVEPGALHVFTNEQLLPELRSHLGARSSGGGNAIGFVAEPVPRNTAPAMALAAAYLVQRDPNALMIVLPSDHLLEDGVRWAETVGVACRAAERGMLVTIGLRPTSPETGYGYIQAGEALEGLAIGDTSAHRVARFVEKPDLATAEGYVASGDYLWNSGMLVARASVVIEELLSAGSSSATPDSANGEAIVRVTEWLASLPSEMWTSDAARERFEMLPSVPFDKAVLEVSNRVAVVPTSLDWSDVGSLLSLATLAKPDERGNVLVGNVTDVDSRNVIAYSADRLVATLGLDDVIVVDTADATLVAAKDRAQDVRLVVDALKALGAPEVVTSRSSVRPWGSWTLLMKGEAFQIKSIDVLPGKRLSVQSHERRSEHWVVVEGEAIVERDGESVRVASNESIYLPIGSRHRMSNDGDSMLRVIEVAVGDYLGEDDIVRYEDDWGR